MVALTPASQVIEFGTTALLQRHSPSKIAGACIQSSQSLGLGFLSDGGIGASGGWGTRLVWVAMEAETRTEEPPQIMLLKKPSTTMR